MEDEPQKDPEAIIRERIDELRDREANRRRAVDMAFDQVANTTGNDQQLALDNLERMLAVNEEFRQAVFPDDSDT